MRDRAAAGLLAVTVALVAGACSGVSSGNVSSSAPAVTATTTTTAVPTLASAPEAAPVGRPDVFVVGDSLTMGAEPWLAGAVRARGWRLTGVDASVGRSVPEGLQVLRRRAGSLPPTVIVALGTNNLGASGADIDAWMATARRTVGEIRRLVWVNLSLADDGSGRQRRYEAINADLATSARRWNVEILDWDRWADRNGIEPRDDGIHYEDGAYRLRARFYAQALPRVSA